MLRQEEEEEAPIAGYTRAYAAAAQKGTAIVEDSDAGVRTNHAVHSAGHPVLDPTAGFRRRVAKNLASKLQNRRGESSGGCKPSKCLDIGCSTGNDLVLLKETLGGSEPGNYEFHGLDLLGAQLVKARENLPEATFVEGNVTALPFADASMDSVQCSRLLIHVPDLSKAIHEILRVVAPGGCGVVAEGNMEGQVVYTSDERLSSVATAMSDHTVSQCANPRSATDAYRELLGNPRVENLVIEPFAVLVSDPSYGMGLGYLQPKLDAMVAGEIIARADADYFLEALPDARKRGDFFLASMMYEVSFDKKETAANESE